MNEKMASETEGAGESNERMNVVGRAHGGKLLDDFSPGVDGGTGART